MKKINFIHLFKLSTKLQNVTKLNNTININFNLLHKQKNISESIINSNLKIYLQSFITFQNNNITFMLQQQQFLYSDIINKPNRQ